jgi:predicted TIM-barrel fold metal-dependent hydrolase
MRVIAIEEHYASAGEEGVLASPDAQAKLRDLGEARIADMDSAGIDVQVLSLTSPGAQAFPAADAVAMTREENDRLADAVGRHPDRLAAFAALPTTDSVAAAAELARTVERHGFKGAMINGLTEGRFLDDRRFWPILECADALRVPIYLSTCTPRLPRRLSPTSTTPASRRRTGSCSRSTIRSAPTTRAGRSSTRCR